MSRYVYCANAPTVANAARVLASSPFLIIDCEGKNIGAADGVLSLMCIGTANAEHIFVFDVLALRSRNALSQLRLVLDLLADPTVKKIMWDCRNDFLEITATYGVLLQGVLDLQLAEIDSRASVRGEKEWKRTVRLAARGRRLPLPLIKQNPDLFSGVHSLQGMDACIKEARPLTTGKDPQVVAMHKTNGSMIWLDRPLLPQLLHYAAHDIEMIGALYEHFRSQSWITPLNEDALVDQSMRYAYSLYHQGRVAEDDVFGSSSVLPLDVLREPRGLTVPCQGCNRMQSLHCFTISRRGRQIVARTNICRVCQIKLLIKQVDHPVSWVNVTTYASR
ncbi:ribonuclease H-like domain-containing protein [Boletus edulis BED1]|uniref:Ribonuclease H-like domain-containing protein n=1 Tax=Boletus edulis BED1 TaxID=1328754 RepID=A0AAD4GGU1_BOLED|nr:ribonuclease H-like domain-containing protein [Boletus edulis BED1]